MNAEIVLDNPNKQPPIIELKDGYITHARCEGARWHVLSYSTLGIHCSERRCIINKSKDKNER